MFQVKSWMAGVVARSPKLSDIFGSSWSFGQMSTVMRCKMSMVHEFELGMISMVDLKHKVRDGNFTPTRYLVHGSLKFSLFYQVHLVLCISTLPPNFHPLVFAGRAQADKASPLPAKGKYSSYARSSVGNGRRRPLEARLFPVFARRQEDVILERGISAAWAP